MNRETLQTHLDIVEQKMLAIAATLQLWKQVGVLPTRYVAQLEAAQKEVEGMLLALLAAKRELGLQSSLNVPEETT